MVNGERPLQEHRDSDDQGAHGAIDNLDLTNRGASGEALAPLTGSPYNSPVRADLIMRRLAVDERIPEPRSKSAIARSAPGCDGAGSDREDLLC